MPKIVIATRRSPLALIQAGHVKGLLSKAHPENDYELLEIVTEGDKILDSPLADFGGKGLFAKDIEKAIIEKRADLAVHNVKDLPAALPRELYISAVLKRENPFDALISREKKRLVELAKGSKIGTSSSRRKAQLLNIRPDLDIIQLRGNVNTRLEKLASGAFDAIILAFASLERMQKTELCSQLLDDRLMVPACGQGALAVESRKGDKLISSLVDCLNDKKTFLEIEAERTVLARLNAGCHAPVGIYCHTLSDGRFHLSASIITPDGKRIINSTRVGIKNVIAGFELANDLLDQGGKEILDSLRKLPAKQ
ncbi:MAG TPA: hydroxymethylbilane synthase [Candidatus Wallbacteria bacterium]|nr:hydroxymethylbilane synthase [Candidatus Wallbacteria bacterium]